MFSFFKKKPPAATPDGAPAVPAAPAAPGATAPARAPAHLPELQTKLTPALAPLVAPAPEPPARSGWMDRLAQGLRKTGGSITQVFTGTRIDDALYEELESALLMADAGVAATEFLLADLKRRVKDSKATEPAAVKQLLAAAITALLKPLEGALDIGRASPTVIMVTGVNGAGKTTSIGKLTRHLAEADCKVLLAAADTFRAAAREQLAVWAGRNQVEIVSQEGGDPAAVTFDAVAAGRARGCDVVIADTAGRLPTQLHLMEELKKIKRVIAKADAGAPHQMLLVVDGNTGQNALTQVEIFARIADVSGLVMTKLDGTARGGVLVPVAQASDAPIKLIGVGEGIEDLQPFDARAFSRSLVGLED
jgi:fused signal recognition particle receptor